MSTILRNSTVPQSFKYSVEEKKPTFKHVNGDTIQVSIGLNSDSETHANSSVDIFGALMKACAEAMSDKKFKNNDKSALVFNKEDNGEIIAAVISDYDKDGENYFYNITFDPADVKGIKNVINYRDFVDESRNFNFLQMVSASYLVAHNVGISSYDVLDIMIITAFEVIYYWLDQNAKNGETVELIIDDIISKFELMSSDEYTKALVPVAIAMVETTKDIKKMSIQFSEELKAIAKGSNDLS